MPQTTNSITPNKLTVPDLISVGVFTALYFVLVTVATFTCALLPGVGNIVLPALAALISGQHRLRPAGRSHRRPGQVPQ